MSSLAILNQCSKKIALAFVLLSAAPAWGQHVDILVFDSGGKIGVGEYDFFALTSSEKRVHLARFNEEYTVDSPGFTAPTGPDSLPGNQELTWEFLPLTVDSGPHAGYRSTLLYWDGAGESPEFGPTATDDYEFSISGFYGSAAAFGSDEIEPGSIIAPTPPNGYVHEHPFYLLDDNGDEPSTTLPAAGIYVLGMRMKISGLEDSEPFFLVWTTPELSILPAIQPAAAWVRSRVDSLFVEGVPGDFDGDGDVDGSDFLTWQRDHVGLGGADALAQWRTTYAGGPTSPIGAFQVPEPTTLSMVSGVGLVWIATRRRRLQPEIH